MAATMKLAKFTKRPDGSCEFVFDYTAPDGSVQSGLGMVFSSLDSLVQEKITPLESLDAVFGMLIGWWRARSADLTNQNVIVGKNFTVDFSAAQPIRVQ